MNSKTLLLFAILNLNIFPQVVGGIPIDQKLPSSSSHLAILKYYFSAIDLQQYQYKPDAGQLLAYFSDQTPSRKSPWLAFGLSYIFPGLGQVYNGEYVKALLFSGTALAGTALAFASIMGSHDTFDEAPATFWIGVAVGGGAYLWSLIDAPISANNINERNGLSGIQIFSTEDEKFVVRLRSDQKFGAYLIGVSLSF